MRCNFCGATLNELDEMNNGNITIRFGYGSKRDGEDMTFALCSDCIDTLTDKFIKYCEVKPKIKTWDI